MLALNLNQIVRDCTGKNAVLDLFFVSELFSNGELRVEPHISDHHLPFFFLSY